tara:strand:+ start:3478 stop:4671 length:1194 start_codon:yes stop_codon:yes gene_type:complete
MNIYLCLLICFFVGVLFYYLIKSSCGCNVVEGLDDQGKYFYAYFGRESMEDSGSYPGITDPPYYILNNVNFADLKGELSFFKTEFIGGNDPKVYGSKPYTYNDITVPYKNGRKYGIQYIDKWLIRYKGDLTDFKSMQNGGVNISEFKQGGSLSSTLGIDGDDYIGVAAQTGSVKTVGNKDGNWLSISGECPNQPIGGKCKVQPCYNDIKNQNDDCSPKQIREMNLVKNIDELRNNASNISALYIGTIRLDDLNGSNQRSTCYNGLNDIEYIPKPKTPYTKDSDVSIWKNLIDPKTDIPQSDAFKLLSNNKAWGCKMVSKKQYTWESPSDLSGINISEICNNRFIVAGSPCAASTPPSPAPPSTPCPSTIGCDPKAVPPAFCPGQIKCPSDGCCPKIP